jgi:alpha-L-rhamnosidase
MLRIGVLVLVLVSAAPCCHSAAPLPASDLRVEYEPLPVFGVAVRKPRLSWALGDQLERGVSQSSYQVVLLNNVTGEMVWDSGVVRSNETLGVAPSVDLISDSRYEVHVEWYDHKGEKAPMASGFFTTAFMEDSDWGNSTWITIPDPDDARSQFRHVMHLPANAVVLRAACYIAGLGYQRSWINGVRLGHANITLGPFLQFQRRIAYDTYDISSILKPGKNVLSVLLGRGWYSLRDDNFTKVLGYRTIGPRALKVVCSVHLNDGNHLRFSSGSGLWRVSAGEIVYDHLFLGETIDKRRETTGWKDIVYDDSVWEKVNTTDQVQNTPSGKLTSFIMPSVQKHEPRIPVEIKRLPKKSGVEFILDFEVNQAMQCTLTFDSDGTDEGRTLRLHHAEQVDADGDIVISNDLGGMEDATTFILGNKRGAQVFETQFAYFGARFVKISGWPENKPDPDPEIMTCYFVHTSLGGGSSIMFQAAKGSDTATILNGIHDITIRSALSNFMSTPTDCPSREKRGWTGDGQTAAETLIYSFDMASSYSKWLGDIVDAQQCNFGAAARSCPANNPFCRVQGDGANIPEITPFLFDGVLNGCQIGSDPAWGSGYIALVDWVYHYYGDAQTLKWHYEAGAAYLDYLLGFVNTTSSGSFLLDLNYPTTRYGDWCAPLPQGAPTARHTSNLINGFFWLKQLRIMATAANRLGFVDDEKKWSEIAERGAQSYNRLYFSSLEGLYKDIECTAIGEKRQGPCHNSSATADSELSKQTAQALPLFLNLPRTNDDRERVGKAMADDVLHGTYPGRTTTGLVGTKYILPELVKAGYAEAALTIATNMQYPSWGRMLPSTVHPLGQGEGTLWENWEGDKHKGFGSRNHIMLGGFDGPYFFGNLAGITNTGLAWSTIGIAPTPCGDLTVVDATVATIRGDIKVKWARPHLKSMNFILNVSIPGNSIARLRIPILLNGTASSVDLFEKGIRFWGGCSGYIPDLVPGIDGTKPGKNAAGNHFDVSIRSGTYEFMLQSASE